MFRSLTCNKPHTSLRQQSPMFTVFIKYRIPPTGKVRSIICFLSVKSVKAAEIRRQICEIYREYIMSDGRIRKWVRAFKNGRNNVHDEERIIITDYLM